MKAALRAYIVRKFDVGGFKVAQDHVKTAHDQVEEATFDFYRCAACRKLITRLEEISIFDVRSPRFGIVCSCGHRRYNPTNLRWYEWTYPRVLWFALLRWLEIA